MFLSEWTRCRTRVVVLLLSLLAGPALGTVRYVPAGSSIQEAVNQSANGDTVLVGPGTFVENITIYGAPGAPITLALLSQAGPDSTFIGHSSTYTGGMAIDIQYGLNVEIGGFTIRNFGLYGIQTRYCEWTFIHNNVIHSMGSSGIEFPGNYPPNSHTVERNTVSSTVYGILTEVSGIIRYNCSWGNSNWDIYCATCAGVQCNVVGIGGNLGPTNFVEPSDPFLDSANRNYCLTVPTRPNCGPIGAELTCPSTAVPPTLTIVSPAMDDTTAYWSPSYPFSGAAADSDGAVTAVEYRVGRGGFWRTAQGTTNWNFVADSLIVGQNQVEVRARDTDNLYSEVASRTITRLNCTFPLAAPHAISPPLGEYGAYPINWNRVPGGILYIVEASSSTGGQFENCQWYLVGTTTDSVKIFSPPAHQFVYWRVRAVLASGDTTNASIGYYFVGSPPTPVPVPRIVSPWGEHFVENTSIPHSWQPVEGAAYYEVQFAKGKPHTQNLFDACDWDSVRVVPCMMVNFTVDAAHCPIYWRVRAADSSGQRSHWAVSYYYVGTCLLCEPNRLPDVQIVDPATDISLRYALTSVAFSGTASDGDGSVTSVEYRVDCGSWQALAGTTSWSFVVDSLAVGVHRVDVRARNNEGSFGTASRTITRQPIMPPTLAVASPASDVSVPVGTTTYAVSGTAGDPDGTVIGVEYRVRGGAWTLAQGTVNWSFTVDALLTGPNLVEVRAVDDDSSYSEIVSRTITRRSTIPPSVAIASPSSDIVIPGFRIAYAFSGTAADSDGTMMAVEFRVRDGPWRPAQGTSNWSFTTDSLLVGPNLIEVRARDDDDLSAVSSRTLTRQLDAFFEVDASTVALYRFNEAGGDSVRDESPNHNDGFNSGAARTPGLFGSALQFDGVDDFVRIARSLSLDPLPVPTMTIEAWILPGRAIAAISSKGLVQGGLQWPWLFGVTGEELVAFVRGDPLNGFGLSSGNWHHVALVYDASGLTAVCRLYIDGTRIATESTMGIGVTELAADVYLGAANRFGVFGDHFDGTMDEVRISNVARSIAAPQLTIASPADDDTIPNSQTGVAFSGDASDTDGNVVLVEYRINAGAWRQASGTTSWSLTADNLEAGSNRIEVRAQDEEGYYSTVANRTINRSPCIGIVRPANDASIPNEIAAFPFAGTATAVGTPVNTIEYRIRGGGWRTAPVMASSWSFLADSLIEGSNLVEVRSRDDEGRTSDVASRAVIRLLPGQQLGSDAATVALYRFDEAAGDTIRDDSPNGNYGLNNGAVRTIGLFGGALQFDGIDDFVRIPRTPSLDPLPWPQMTFEAWIKPSTGGGVITEKALISGSPCWPWYFLQSGTSVTARLCTCSGGFGGEGLSVGNWHHVAFAYDGTGPSTRLYVDGDLVATSTDVGTCSRMNLSADVYLGAAYHFANPGNKLENLFQGTLDEVRFSNVARSFQRPQVAIVSPSSDQSVPNSQTSMTFAGTAGDGDEIVIAVDYRVGGGPWQAAAGTTAWSFTFDLPVGENLVEVRSQDNEGLRSLIASRTVGRSPFVRIVQPASDKSIPASVTTYPFAGTAWAVGTGVGSIEYRIQGRSWRTAAVVDSNWTFTADSLTAGSNVIEVRSRDDEGHYSAVASATINQLPWGQHFSVDANTVALYRFDESEASGDTIRDDSPNGNHGTNHGATRVDGFLGRALRFDGIDDFVRIARSATLDLLPGSAMTIEAWVQPEGTRGVISSKALVSGSECWPWVLRQSSTDLIGLVRGCEGSVSGVGLFPGDWHLIALVYDATGYDAMGRLYVDGNLVGENVNLETRAVQQAADLYLGAAFHFRNPGLGLQESFRGLVDEIRISNVARPIGLPQLMVLVPPADDTVPNSQTSFAFSGEALDINGVVTQVEFRVGAGAWQMAQGTTSWGFLADNLAVGDNRVEVRAKNNEGFYSPIVSRIIGRSPLLSIAQPAHDAGVANSVDSYPFMGTAQSVGTGVSTVEYRVRGGAWRTAPVLGSSWSFVADSLVQGPNLVEVFARDDEGHSSVVASKTIMRLPPNQHFAVDANTVALYRFEEAYGDTVRDDSPYGNHGLRTGATRLDALFGRGLRFDGIDDFVRIPRTPSLDVLPGSAMTIEAWVNLESSGRHTICEKALISGSDCWPWTFTTGPLTTLRAAVKSCASVDGAPPSLGEWHLVVLVYDQGMTTLYLDGLPATGSRLSPQLVNLEADLYLGAAYHLSNPGNHLQDYFHGTLEELRISNVARSIAPPQVAISTPGPVTAIPSPETTYAVSGTSSDGDGIVMRVEFRVRGGPWRAASGLASWSFVADSLIAGDNRIEVRALDNDGYYSTVASCTIQRSPFVSVTQPSADAIVLNAQTSQPFSGTASSLGGNVVQVEYRIRGGDWQPAQGTTSWSFVASGLLVGGNSIEVRARDDQGYYSAATSRTVSRLQPDTYFPVDANTVALYHFNEAMGTQLFDASPNGNHGGINGAAARAAGRFGGGLHFDGRTSFVKIAASTSLNPLPDQQMTIEAWVKMESRQRSIICNKALLNTDCWPWIFLDAGTGLQGVVRACTPVMSTNPLPLQEWRYVALVYDNGIVSLYTDGNLDAQGSVGARNTLPTDVYLGAAWHSSNPGNHLQDYFQGTLDEVRISNVARTIRPPQFLEPSVSIGSPATDTSIPSTESNLGFSGTGSDLDGSLVRVEYRIGSGAWTQADGTAEWSFWATNLLPGPNPVEVRALDSDGLYSAMASRTVTRLAGDAYFPMDAGTVALYRFNEAAGDTVRDESPNGYHGVLNGAARVPGRFGGALGFDGLDDLVRIAGRPALDSLPGSKFTVEAWIQPQEAGRDQVFCAKERQDSTQCFPWMLAAGDSLLLEGEAKSCSLAVGSRALGTGEWRQVALVYDADAGGKTSLYMDGALEVERALPPGAAGGGGDIDIGALRDGTTRYAFRGVIDEVRISNIARFAPLEVDYATSGAARSTGQLDLIVVGRNLDPDSMRAWLRRGTGPVIQTTAGAVRMAPTRVGLRFDLDGAAPGAYDLFVANRTGTDSLLGAVIVYGDSVDLVRSTAAVSAHGDQYAAASHGSAPFDSLVFVSDRGAGRGLYVKAPGRVDAFPLRRLTNSGSSVVRWPSWSPDGRRIAYEQDGEIFVVDVDSGLAQVPRPLLPGGTDGHPAWSPFASMLALHRATGTESAIFLVDGSGNNLGQLTHPTGGTRDLHPAWSPDGVRLAFERDGNLYHVPAASGDVDGLRQLTSTSAPIVNTEPAWSPDGRWIAFASNRSGNSDVFVMDARGEDHGLMRITTDPADDRQPAWTRDGSQLFFSSSRDSLLNIFVVPNLPLRQDEDGDQVPDPLDACAGTPIALGQFDHDQNGCPDSTSSFRHVRHWSSDQLPALVELEPGGDPRITDGSDLDAVRDGFSTWTAAPNVRLSYQVGVQPGLANAVAGDGRNTVTFSDPDGYLPGLVAIAVLTSVTSDTLIQGRWYRPGDLVDADILFNTSRFSFSTPSSPGPAGSYDLQSVAAHEAGHFFGLSHSCVQSATMFYVVPRDPSARTLEPDDAAQAERAYPVVPPPLSARGKILKSDGTTPIAGAAVLAIGVARSDTLQMTLTGLDGTYRFFGIGESFRVYVLPLDGTQTSNGLLPSAVNADLASLLPVDFLPEYWDVADTNSDSVSTGSIVTMPGPPAQADIVTNRDVVGPVVVATSPSHGTPGVPVTTVITVRFNEPVELASLNQSTIILTRYGEPNVNGTISLLQDRKLAVFAPNAPLRYEADYDLKIQNVRDVSGNLMSGQVWIVFITEPQPPLTLSSASPPEVTTGGDLVLRGTGFDVAAERDSVTFQGSNGPVVVTPYAATLDRLFIRVPEDAVSGPISVRVGGSASVSLELTVVPPRAEPTGTRLNRVTVGNDPRKLAVRADGAYVYVATANGVTVVTDPSIANDTASIPIAGGCTGLVTLPDRSRLLAIGPLQPALHVIDTAPGSATIHTEIQSLDLPETPLGIAVLPGGADVLVVYAGRVAMLSAAAGTLGSEVRSWTQSDIAFLGDVTVAAGAEEAYATTSDGRIAVLGLGFGEGVVVRLLTGAEPREIAGLPTSTHFVAVDANGYVRLFGARGPLRETLHLGGGYNGIAVSPDGGFAFAANEIRNTVDVLDLRGDGLASPGVFATEDRDPRDVATGHAGRYLYVITGGSGKLEVYDTESSVRLLTVSPPSGGLNTVLTLHGSGFDPVAINNRVLLGGAEHVPLAVNGSGTVAVVRQSAAATTGAVVVRSGSSTSNPVRYRTVSRPNAGRFAMGPGFAAGIATPRNLVASPNGRYLVAIHDGGGLSLHGADPTRSGFHQLLQTVEPSGPPASHAAAMTPDGAKLYVASTSGGTDVVASYGVYDDAPSRLVRQRNVRSSGQDATLAALTLATTPAGDRLLVGDVTNAVFEVSTPSDSVLASIAGFENPRCLLVHPRGQVAYVGCTSGGGSVVRTLDVDPESPTYRTPGADIALEGEGAPYQLVASPDGNRLFALVRFSPGYRVHAVSTDAAVPATYHTVVGTLVLAPGDAIPSMAVNHGGSLLFVTDANIAAQRAYDPSTLSGPITGPTGSQLVAGRAMSVSLDDARLYAVGSDSTLVSNLTPASGLAFHSGTQQVAVVNRTLPVPVVARVLADPQELAEGTAVSFRAAGLGLLGSQSRFAASADANGLVRATYTAGPLAGIDSVIVELGSMRIVSPILVAADTLTMPLQVLVVAPDSISTPGINTAIAVDFSKEIRPTSIDSTSFAMSAIASGQPLPGTFFFANNRHRVVFRPSEPLQYRTYYRLRLTDAIEDHNGNGLWNPGTFGFTTELEPSPLLAAIEPPAARRDDPVVLSGQGFSVVPSENRVFFGDLEILPVRSDPGALVVNVPTDAVTDSVHVVVRGRSSNTRGFTVLLQAETPVRGILAPAPLPTGASSIVILPDRSRAYMTSPEVNAVVPLHIAIQAIERIVPVGIRPFGIANSPSGDRVYVTNFLSDELSIIDTDPASPTFHSVIASIPVVRNPTGIAASPDGRSLYVVGLGDSTLTVIDVDPTSGSLYSPCASFGIGAPSQAIAVTPDGARLLVGTPTGLSILDANSGDGSGRVSIVTGSLTRTVAATPDGAFALALSGGILHLFDIRPGSPTENTARVSMLVGETAQTVAISPDGAFVYLVRSTGRLEVLRILQVRGLGKTRDDESPLEDDFDLVRVDSLEVGENPVGLAFDRGGSGLLGIVNAGDRSLTFVQTEVVTATREDPVLQVTRFALLPCAPNPFRGTTGVFFQLPEPADVSIRIYSVDGRLVRVLARQPFLPGRHTLFWDGRNGSGHRVASGVYLLKAQAGRWTAHQKLVLLH